MPPSFFCAARALLRSQATLFLRAVRMWRDADGLRMSAAMSFYGMLSLAPAILNLSSRRSGHRLWPLCQARDHEFDQCGPAGKVAVGGERAHVLKQALAAGDELT